MKRETHKARERVKRAEHELETARANLEIVELDYKHDWMPPKYTPDVREAHQAEDLHGHFIQGQPPRMVSVPREETPKWTRTCRKCGKVETTTKTTERVERRPTF